MCPIVSHVGPEPLAGRPVRHIPPIAREGRLMETSDVRRQVKDAIQRSRRLAADRRTRNTEATEAFERFRSAVVEPLLRQVAGALTAEGYPFTVHTPASGVRLASERSTTDFVEIRLDTSGPLPEMVARVERAKGRETLIEDRPLKPGAPVEHVTEADVLGLVLDVLPIFIER